MSSYPMLRPRRMRSNVNLRRLMRETTVSTDNLIAGMFVRHGQGIQNPIGSMPGPVSVFGRSGSARSDRTG